MTLSPVHISRSQTIASIRTASIVTMLQNQFQRFTWLSLMNSVTKTWYLSPYLSLSLSVYLLFFSLKATFELKFRWHFCQSTSCFPSFRCYDCRQLLRISIPYIFGFTTHSSLKYNSRVTVNFSSRNQIVVVGLFVRFGWCIHVCALIKAFAHTHHFLIFCYAVGNVGKTSCFVLFVPYSIVVSVCMFAIDFWIKSLRNHAKVEYALTSKQHTETVKMKHFFFVSFL